MQAITVTWRDENYGSGRHLHAFRVYTPWKTEKARKAFVALAKAAGFDSDARRACYGSNYNEDAATKLIEALAGAGYEVTQAGCKQV